MTVVKDAPGSRPRAARAPRRETQHRDSEVCPRCGRATARIIGRSEFFPVLYLRCDECRHTSVAPL
jgi:hypothetical protein